MSNNGSWWMFHDSSKYIKLQRAAKMLSPSIFTFQKCNTQQTKKWQDNYFATFYNAVCFVYIHANVHQKTSISWYSLYKLQVINSLKCTYGSIHICNILGARNSFSFEDTEMKLSISNIHRRNRRQCMLYQTPLLYVEYVR